MHTNRHFIFTEKNFGKEQKNKRLSPIRPRPDRHYKKSILARAFRGELGTNDPTDEPAVELLKKVLEEKS